MTTDQCLTVKIEITPNQLAVVRPPIQSLHALLEQSQHSFETGGKYGYRECVTDVAFCHFFDDAVIFQAGFVPRVVHHLEDEGYDVTVVDRRLGKPSLMPNLELLETMEQRERSRLEAVLKNPLGQIEVRDKDDAGETCASIGRLFPAASVLIVLPNREQAKHFADDLPYSLCEPVDLFVSGVKRKNCRCTVAVGQTMPGDGTWDVVIFPCGEKSVGDEVRARVGGHNFFAGRRYAFITPGLIRDRTTALQLEQLAGEVIHRVARPRLPVSVVMLPTPHCRTGKAKTPLTRKRARYWGNKKRNEFLTKFATMLTADPVAVLSKLVGKKMSVKALTGDEELRVAVLVDSVEQLRNLAQLLPTWRLRAAEEDALRGLPSNAAAKHIIMTAVYAAKVGYDAHVVIRATGGSGPLRIKGFPFTTEAAVNRSLALVIDFNDQFHKFVAKDTERRRQAYERLEMPVRDVAASKIASIMQTIPFSPGPAP